MEMRLMNKFRTLDPCTMLAPVPVVMVSCQGMKAEDKPNIITIAWAGTVNSQPPMVSVSIRKERFSHHLIKESGEFVVNLVDEQLCRACDYCGVKSGRDVDKFAEMELTAMPALGLEHAPAIAQAPVYLSCKVRHVLELGCHDMFIGEIVGVQVREDLFDPDGSLHLESAGLVAYNHGVYQRTKDVLGFFGYSVARPDVLERRMKTYHR